MLISKIPDNDMGKGESVVVPEEESDSHEYQTANELFELMAKSQHFDTSDVEKLTTRDLVLLYKNIDLGTKLMSNNNELQRKKPNQHVESVVYNDESDSDASERYSSEDLRSVFLLNSERLDLLTTQPSTENTLCHKLGDLQMQTSCLTTEYDKHFLFNDPYIKEQLKSLKVMNKPTDIQKAVLPASLLDYVCCKRLEDNYNFYMDNIIRYVQNTIDQLKSISNGDYLTDKAKEKWREVEGTTEDLQANTKVLATSTSIPLHVERKISGQNTTWDDLVHSAVDIRSLSKILEKRIVVEVPKLLCGPYKLLSKCCAENVIISCKKDKPVEERVDVVFQLQRSETGQVISNINSIMILQSAPVEYDLERKVLPLPLTYKEPTNNDASSLENKSKIIELEPIMESVHTVSAISEGSIHSSENAIDDSLTDDVDFGCSDIDVTDSFKNSSFQGSSDAGDALKDILDRKPTSSQWDASTDVFSDDLRMTMRKLTTQSALTEESGEELSQPTSKKKKSPMRVRIKSPYENQSYIIEEKKRRKLLEIRERRERKKMALVENSKVTKHKYGKGTTFPQSASSVTKLSISNKSFYDSIYGQTTNADPNKQVKGRNQKGGTRNFLEINMDDNNEGDENDESVMSTPDRNSKKYINRSYYLDDADTEMMYTNMNRNENDAKDFGSTSTSAMSNDFHNNINYLSQLICPFETAVNIDEDKTFPKVKLLSATIVDDVNDERTSKELRTPKCVIKVPLNSPNINGQDNTEPKKVTPSVECKKSIDKIYTLMNKLGKGQQTENKSTKSKLVAAISKKIDEKEGRMSSIGLGSESGTSLKHRLPSSYPSSFSFNKNNTEKPNNTHNKKSGGLLPVVPKVVLSSKSLQVPKTDLENNGKNCKRSGTNISIKVPENPLKAISQILHEFENVQKSRRKLYTEQKHAKKIEMASNDGISESRKISSKRRSRLDKHNDSQIDRNVRLSPKEKKPRQHKEIDVIKIPYQQIPVQIPDDKHTDKLPKKKIIEMLDEAKEARGEAVRGPSKLTSRLNSLAQPKRTYVQAHSEEYQTKYGRTLMADRLQRLAAAPQPSERPPGCANTRNRAKRSGSEAVPAIRAWKSPPSPVPPSERAYRSHSPSRIFEPKERLNQGMGASYKQVNVPETPQTLKKKMVAVESYVKNHYGRSSPTSLNRSDPQTAQKLRVPLLPNNIDIASSTSSAPFQESTELGSKLHNIINSIMETTNSQVLEGLEVLTEGQESTDHVDNRSSTRRSSSDSDYALDVLNDDNVITSVENIDKATEKEQKQTNCNTTGAVQIDLQPDRFSAELEKLENALCNHFPVGTFQKRLRIKNLTMTPKQSIKQVFVLESGDAGSLVVQTPIATALKENTSKRFNVTSKDLTTMPILSKPHLDWGFSNFPMQISTVGYAFMDYKSIQCNSNSLVRLFDTVSKKTEEENLVFSTNHKSVVSKVEKPTLHTEQAAQVDIVDAATTLVTVGISTSQSLSTHVIESDKKEKMQKVAINAEPKRVFIDFSQNDEEGDTLKGRVTKTHAVSENKENISETDKPENAEYTTSLDILVGLLNEIQNITSRQTQITKSDNQKSLSEIQQSKVLETLLINEAANEMGNSMKSSRCDVVSFTSLDRLRQLESNQSLYSFYLSDREGSEKGTSKLNFPSEIMPVYTNELWCPKSIYVDREVGVDLGDVTKFTEDPSKVLPHDMSHSTNMTNSLVTVHSNPSIQLLLFADCPLPDSNPAPLGKKSIQHIPQILITEETKQNIDFYDVINEKINKPENKPHTFTIRSLEKERIKNLTNLNNGKFRFKTDFDPIMKMKRDILVTVYSILVFTVFAALSFPEILYPNSV